MTSIDRTLRNVVAALAGRQHVDIIGARLSGRTALLGQLVARFRRDGWDVREVSGRGPQTLLPRLDTDRALIAVDDWDLLDDETRVLATASGATLVTTRAGGEAAVSGMQAVVIPRLDADTLRVLLTRVVGFVIETDDAVSLAQLTDGAVGAAVGVATAALRDGTLTVTGGRAHLHGAWLGSAATVVSALLEPLTPAQQELLAQVAQGGTEDAPDLVRLGYLDAQTGAVSSTLLSRWFTRQ